MSSKPANIFSEQLENLKNTFSNLMGEMEPININCKLHPEDQSYSSSCSNWSAALYTCNKNMTTLNNEVNDSIITYNDIVNKLLSDIDSTNKFSKIIPNLFEKKNTSSDMKIDNMSLYNYQILLNWEMFIGMVFLFFCLIFYYRKYYNTKEVIEYTKQKIIDIKEDVSNNIKSAKEEITKLSEPPPIQEIPKETK